MTSPRRSKPGYRKGKLTSASAVEPLTPLPRAIRICFSLLMKYYCCPFKCYSPLAANDSWALLSPLSPFFLINLKPYSLIIQSHLA